MTSKPMTDFRIDPRIKRTLAGFELPPAPNVESRAELLAEFESPDRVAEIAAMRAFLNSMDTEDIAPSTGLTIQNFEVVSAPDKNKILIQFIRPEGSAVLPCVYYIHGGGMAIFSCFDGNYRVWGRMLAAQNVAVAMVDFRNSLSPSSSVDVAAFPASLNDCISGLRWVHENAALLRIDSKRLIVAGESGGGNLAISSTLQLCREDDVDKIAGLYAMCPYISGEGPLEEYPSQTENDGIMLNLNNNRDSMAYGIEAFRDCNPLAWPRFATGEDVENFPKTMIRVHECDPLRDEGIAFYRLLAANGVQATCQQIMGTVHAIEVFPACCPDLSRDAARSIAGFAKDNYPPVQTS
ncbi:alpha/beta hydrolase fold domain-containing protein [Parasphingorhabdus sp.]|uniref:alpha/beta hydrolase fold domain-containing protein n=1 Tax=Parasphingorhabdus sp. TaxID=2709688 RepID=UPI003A8EFB92